MADSLLTKPPNAAEIRAELESYVLGDLHGPASGESEDLTECTARDRYLFGVLAPSRSMGAAANGRPDSTLNHSIHETKQSVRFTISEPARRKVLQRLLKLNHERCAEVKQGLHRKKKGAANTIPSKKNSKRKQIERPANLFDNETDE